MKWITRFLIFLTSVLSTIPVYNQPGRDTTVTVNINTELGNIKAILFIKQAPVTCANFLKYVEMAGEWGGTFYRTVTMANQPDNKVKIEVIQGGFDPESIAPDQIQPLPLERTTKTGLFHKDGTLSMARNDPDSGTTEFFICIGDQPALDFGGKRNPDGQGFAAFGQVTDGMEIVKKIQAAPADGQTLTPPVMILNIGIN